MPPADAIAIIPARGGSKRLLRKNILPINGRPMLSWPVQAALESGVFSQVIVSTEDAEIAEVATAQGARVIVRPDEMATDTAHEFSAYLHVLQTLKGEGVEPEYFCGLYATAVLITPNDLRGAFEKIVSNQVNVVMGVSAYAIHPYKALERSAEGYLRMVYPEQCKQRTQTYPHYVASNGTLYFLRTKFFLKDQNYYPEKLLGFEIPADRAVDLDTEDDYKMLKLLMAIHKNGEGHGI